MAEIEELGACKYAIKTFTLEQLGAGSPNAGGPRCKKNRFDVLDRLSRLRSMLSAGQKNDWLWFKEAWDTAMIAQHKEQWAQVFSGWVQEVLNDPRGNAFSVLVYNETCRVFRATAALHVPGR
jgi:hypothetical protein